MVFIAGEKIHGEEGFDGGRPLVAQGVAHDGNAFVVIAAHEVEQHEVPEVKAMRGQCAIAQFTVDGKGSAGDLFHSAYRFGLGLAVSRVERNVGVRIDLG